MDPNPTPFALALLLAAALAAPAAAEPGGEKNLILISIDTLRPDHLGSYGYPRNTSPATDRLRGDSILFTHSIAHASSTLPSHASMMTSLFPHQHRASKRHETTIGGAGTPTLAEELKAHGFHTAGFHNGGQVSAEYGMNRGFGLYELVPEWSFSAVVDRSVAWLDKQPREPFFLFLHTYEVHHPYRPKREHLEAFDTGYEGALPDAIEIDLLEEFNRKKDPRPLSKADLQHIIATYDAGIVSIDLALAKLIAHLKENGQYDDTVIIFTSDHGEEFGERSSVGWHSHTLYEELLRVPLLIKLAGSEKGGSEVGDLARGIDIAPTALAALDIPAPATYEGRDLLSAKKTPQDREDLSVSWLDGFWTDPSKGTYAIRTGPWKFYNGRLFNLANDPGEERDVSSQHPEIAERLRLRLLSMAEEAQDTEESTPADVKPATEEQLRALGYGD